jgi:PAS domain S-box-containing protein
VEDYVMAKRPTYRELEQRVRELEKEAAHRRDLEERAYLETTLASAPDGVLVLDEQGRFAYVNPSFLRWLGREAKDFVGKTVRDVSPPFMSPEATRVITERAKKRVKSGEPIVGAEVEIIDKAGKPMLVSYSAAGIRDNKGDILGEVVFIREVTERKRAEEALRESENKYRELADLLPQTVFEIDERGNFTFANRYGFESSGYTQEDLDKGLNALQLFIPEDRERVAQNIRKILAGERSQGYEYTALRKDGSTFPVLIYSSPIIRDNKPVGLRGVAIDMTERKKMEKALQESEEKYRGLFENASDAIFIADTKTDRILDANRQAERLLGRTRDEIIDMHQSELHIPRHAEYSQDRFRRQGQKGRVLALQAEVVRKNGSVVPVFISSSVISIRGEEVIQALLRDVTEEKRILDLTAEITTKKLIEMAKGVLMDRHSISEKEAMSRLQKESRRQRKKVKEIAQGVISSELMLN